MLKRDFEVEKIAGDLGASKAMEEDKMVLMRRKTSAWEKEIRQAILFK